MIDCMIPIFPKFSRIQYDFNKYLTYTKSNIKRKGQNNMINFIVNLENMLINMMPDTCWELKYDPENQCYILTIDEDEIVMYKKEEK